MFDYRYVTFKAAPTAGQPRAGAGNEVRGGAWFATAGVCLAGFIGSSHPYLGLMTLAATAGVSLAPFAGNGARVPARGAEKLAGDWGESRGLQELSALPDNHTVFNALNLSDSRGTAEIDLVVVSPSGVWVIEVKNWRGLLRGNAVDPHWTQYGNAQGTPWRTLGNPLRQLNYYGDKIARQMNGSAPVRRLLYLASPSCTVELSGRTRAEIVYSGRLARHLVTQAAVWTEQEREVIVRRIAQIGNRQTIIG